MNAEKLHSLVQKYSLDLAKTGIQSKQIDSVCEFNARATADFIGHARHLIEQLSKSDIEKNITKAKEILATVQTCLVHTRMYKFDEIQAHNRS